MEPLTIATQSRYWGQIASDMSGAETATLASALLDEAQQAMEHDVATWFQAQDPWRDTFGLWVLTAEPHATARLRDLLFSIAIRYGGIAARDGFVRGIRHPFHGAPLVSGSAHLAAGLWRVGIYPTLVPDLVGLVRASRTSQGAWGDPGQSPDILTTLASADILGRLDPSFDPGPTSEWFVKRQEPSGWWRALGPEVPWLTAAVVDWLEAARRPFQDRFSWPSTPVWARDRLTGLTTVATLDEFAHVLAGLDSLAAEPLDLAFLDLAGFREWNTAYGQSNGDALLGVLGRTLLDIPRVLPVRIGGDEFLILAKPGASDLADLLDDWRSTWPSRLAEAEMPASVAPRILVGHDRAGRLRDASRRLGDGIAALKRSAPNPPPTGVLAHADRAPG
jgi:GGDEF domain-containing protein